MNQNLYGSKQVTFNGSKFFILPSGGVLREVVSGRGTAYLRRVSEKLEATIAKNFKET